MTTTFLVFTIIRISDVRAWLIYTHVIDLTDDYRMSRLTPHVLRISYLFHSLRLISTSHSIALFGRQCMSLSKNVGIYFVTNIYLELHISQQCSLI